MKFLLTAILILSFSAAQAVDAKSANELLAKTLKDAGAAAGVNNNLKIDLVKGQVMIEEAKGNLTVTKIDFDTKSRNFSAYVSSDNNIPFEVAGQFTETAKIPTLSRKFDKDEIITKNDITYLEIEASKLRNVYVTKEEQLIGKSPVHAILKERPIYATQVADARVVKKNKQIAMVYKDSSLTISTSGVALEDGAVGQSVRVKNMNSNRVVRAKILSEAVVEVQSSSQLASN